MRSYISVVLCNDSFSRNADPKEHIETHTVEKPYQCTKTDECFPQNIELKRHIGKHTGEKTYQYTECDECFP